VTVIFHITIIYGGSGKIAFLPLFQGMPGKKVKHKPRWICQRARPYSVGGGLCPRNP